MDHLSTAHCLKDFQLCPQAFQLVNSGRAHIDEDSWQNVKQRGAKCPPPLPKAFCLPLPLCAAQFSHRLFPVINYFVIISFKVVIVIAHVRAGHFANNCFRRQTSEHS